MVDTIKFSDFDNGGDLEPNQTTVGIESGTNTRFNNPFPLLAPGSTGDRPSPAANMYYRLRFNTTLESYEYYSPITATWIQLEDSDDLLDKPFVVYTDTPSLPSSFNLGGLTSGLLKQQVIAGVATPMNAILDTDYYGPGMTGYLEFPAGVKDPNDNIIVAFDYVALGVNYLGFINNIAAGFPYIQAYGPGADIGINLQTKGQGAVHVLTSAEIYPFDIYSGTGEQHLTRFIMANTAQTREVTWPDASGTVAFTDTASGIVNPGLINELAYYASAGSEVSGLTTGNDGVLITSATGEPSISSTLPDGIAASDMDLTDPLINVIYDVNGLPIVDLSASALAVNYLRISNNPTGIPVVLTAIGSDTNIGLQFNAKGAEIVEFRTELSASAIAFITGTSMQHTTAFTFANTSASRAVTWPDADGTVALLDGDNNLSANNFLGSFSTTATAAGTTTLNVASAYRQEFTGATTQTVELPVTSTLVAGHSFQIINNSSGNVTINSSGGNAVLVMASNTSAFITCILTSGTTAASWNASYIFDNGAGVLSITGTANQIDASASTGAITLSLPANQIITEWVAYTPTFTAFGTATGIEVWSRRVGDTLEIRGKFTSGTSIASECRMTLGYAGTNANVTSSNTKITGIQMAGSSVVSYNASTSFYTLIESNTGYITFSAQGSGNNGLTKGIGSSILGTGNTMSFICNIPINTWP